MSPRFVLGRENVPCVAEVVNTSLKADCTDFMQKSLEVMAPHAFGSHDLCGNWCAFEEDPKITNTKIYWAEMTV